MPPRALDYAITDRHLLSPHQSHREYLPTAAHASPITANPTHNQGIAPPPSNTPTASTEARTTHNQAATPSPPTISSVPLAATLLEALLHQARSLAHQGVDFLQIREKDLPAPDLLTLAHGLRALIPTGSKLRLLLNLGHHALSPAALLDLATAARLDGLHLPSALAASAQPNNPHPLNADALATLARDRFAAAGLPPPILSASTHTLADIDRLRPTHPDLLLFGPVFGKVVRGTPVHPPLGLATLAAAVQHAAPIPVLALGGLTPANTPDALRTGAAGIAAIRLFLPL